MMEKVHIKTPVDLYHKFESEIIALGGLSILLEKNDFVKAVQQQIINSNSKFITIYESPLIEKLELKKSLNDVNKSSIYWLEKKPPKNFDYDDYRRKLIETNIGIVGAGYLISESGTIVFSGNNHTSQLITLLPSTLIVLATTRQIVSDLNDLHLQLERGGHNQNSLCYITGPSKTADIEKTLIFGVHGPKNLQVFVLKID